MLDNIPQNNVCAKLCERKNENHEMRKMDMKDVCHMIHDVDSLHLLQTQQKYILQEQHISCKAVA